MASAVTCVPGCFVRTLFGMPIAQLDIDDSREDLLEGHVHSLTTTRADPLAASHAGKFENLVTDWMDTESVRIKLVIAISQAVANAYRIDMQLNGVVDEVVNALKQIPDTTLKENLQQSLLKGQPPSTFKRPILSEQLTVMKVWPATLAGSSVPALANIEKTLSPLLPLASQAELDVAKAKQDLVDWKNIGRWKLHIDRSNAERAAAYGDLLEVPHKNPEVGLSSDYADQFFLHDTSRRGATKVKSSKQIGDEIEAVKMKLAGLEKQHAEALEREAAEADHRAATEQKQKELAALKEQEKESKAKQKQLEKELKLKR